MRHAAALLALLLLAGPALAQGTGNSLTNVPGTNVPGTSAPGTTAPGMGMPGAGASGNFGSGSSGSNTSGGSASGGGIPGLAIPGLAIPGPNIPGSIFSGTGMPNTFSPGTSAPGGVGQLYGGTGLPPLPGTALPFTCPTVMGGRLLATSDVYDGPPLRGMPAPGRGGAWTLRRHNWPGNAYYLDCEYGLDRPPLGIRLPSHVRSCKRPRGQPHQIICH